MPNSWLRGSDILGKSRKRPKHQGSLKLTLLWLIVAALTLVLGYLIYVRIILPGRETVGMGEISQPICNKSEIEAETDDWQNLARFQNITCIKGFTLVVNHDVTPPSVMI